MGLVDVGYVQVDVLNQIQSRRAKVGYFVTIVGRAGAFAAVAFVLGAATTPKQPTRGEESQARGN
jgi:hypothetical protein